MAALGSASLALLKNNKGAAATAKAKPAAAKAAPAAPAAPATVAELPKKKGIALKAKAETPAPVADQVQVTEAADEEIDVTPMSEEELAAFMEENNIAAPEGWDAMSLEEKKAAIQAAEEEAEAEAPPATPAPKAAAQAAAKAKAETKAETKAEAKPAAAKSKAKPPADENDLIAVTAFELENLGEEEARSLVRDLQNETELHFFKLGGVLAKVQENNWFQPYESFRAYIETEHGIQYRKAMYFIQIYNSLVNTGIPYSQVAHIGWTKLKAIVPVLTKQNAKKWIGLAEKQNLVTLEQSVKSSQQAADKKEGAASAEAAGSNEASQPLKSKTFKLHADQAETVNLAIEKAKGASGTDVEAVALEFICMEYMGSTGHDVKTLLAGLGLDKALEVFNDAFPTVSLEATVTE